MFISIRLQGNALSLYGELRHLIGPNSPLIISCVKENLGYITVGSSLVVNPQQAVLTKRNHQQMMYRSIARCGCH